ncbi:MAG: hypothetical protein J7K77_05135 [Dehalococcoidales bacterium]|nr:hypothetical protein [Dehalococcoidales bacterium]
MIKSEPLEEIPTTRPGDRVLRRQKKSPGKLHTFSQNISRLFKGSSSKQPRMK